MTPDTRAPVFFDTPALDWCWATIVSLSAEVSALRDRLERIEVLAVEKGVLLAGEVDSFSMSPEQDRELKAHREAFTGRVFQAIDREFESLD